jgi:hypothetical protein
MAIAFKLIYDTWSCEMLAYEPLTPRDDSGLPDWLTKSNETYFSELHRTVDDVPAQVGFCLSRRSTGRGW